MIAWTTTVARNYRNDPVMVAAAKYLSRRGGLNNDQRDEILSMVAEAYARAKTPILVPEHWARSVAYRRLLEYRRTNAPLEEKIEAAWGDKLIESTEALQVAVLRKCIQESGVTRIAEVLSWGDPDPLMAFVERHLPTRTFREVAVMALMRKHWPESADYAKHTPADVIEGLAKRIRRTTHK